MSKLNKKQKYNPEEVLDDITQILDLLKEFEDSSLENLDIEKFGTKIDNVTKNIKEKYPDSLDSKK